MDQGYKSKSIGLEPLKAQAMNKMKVFGFDVETVHSKETYKGKEYIKQEFLMGSVVGPDHEHVFDDAGEMRDYLLSRATRDSIIAATNLEFDFNILFRKQEHLDKFFLISNNRLIAAIHREENQGKIRKWTMVDTMNYLPRSLEVLGSIVGIKKAPRPDSMMPDPDWDILARPPENPVERHQLTEYNLNDSRITQAFMTHFRDFCTVHNMRLKLTIASTGMDFWRRNYQPWTMWREPVRILDRHFLGAFRGGRTEVFKRGTYNDKVWYYDYRSSYPGVMVKGTDGKGSYPDPSSWHHSMRSTCNMIEQHDGICHAHIKAPYMNVPPLGVRTPSKLLFPTGTFSGWFTNHELKICMDHGYEIDPGEMVYYTRSWEPFKEAVEYLYRLRRKYKLDKHVYEQMVKLIMNSGLFGKWGMNWNNLEELVPMGRVSFDSKGRCVIDGSIADDVSLSPTSEGFGSFAIRRCHSSPPQYSSPVLSTYTTMLGRMKLWNDTYKHHERLVYEDTDSAVMTRPVLEEGTGIGDWELERVTKGGIFIRPKLYMLRPGDDGVLISRSKGMKNIAYDKEKDITSENCFVRSISAGKVSINRFTRMKESLRMGIHSGSVMNLTKLIGLEDDKRSWPGLFKLAEWQNSEPLKLIDGLTPTDNAKAELKAREHYKRQKAIRLQELIRSDKFDSAMVGADISNEEFIDEEKWFARFG